MKHRHVGQLLIVQRLIRDWNRVIDMGEQPKSVRVHQFVECTGIKAMRLKDF